MRIRELAAAVVACLKNDDALRSLPSHLAFHELLASTGGTLVSVGGGPNRVHERFVNLNILFAENIDIVGNAYALPFGRNAVAGLHCEAVLEHLELPDVAVGEMFRVLRPGGLVFAATPFLQSYHGYPDHFQNFTLHGHQRLFERAGFSILQSGTCVGPTFVMVDLLANCARELAPGRLFSRASERLVRISGRLLRLADIALRHHPGSSKLSSSTFVLARKAP